jgi:uncharacterized protein YkwD
MNHGRKVESDLVRKVIVLAVLAAAVLPLWADGTIDRDALRISLFDRINRDRERHGLSTVRLDLEASQIADEYCIRQIENGTRGHFTSDGLSPYMRYSFSGIFDKVLENAAAWSAREPLPEHLVPRLLEMSHNEMLMELPPNDGHRKAILDPWATDVGIGFAWNGVEVRLVEVFFRKGVEWVGPRQTVTAGESGRYRFRLLEAHPVDEITVHYERNPYRLSSERANQIGGYGLPPVWKRWLPPARVASFQGAIGRPPAGGEPRFIRDGNELALDVDFSNGPGIYTIVVWMRPDDGSRAVGMTNLSVLATADRGARGGASGY